MAWKDSCPGSLSFSIAVRRDGIIWDRPVDAVDVAVEGRCVLYAAIFASERAVRVRPLRVVSPQKHQFTRIPDIVAAVHASRLSCTARGRRSTAPRIVPRPIAVCSAPPSRSQGRAALMLATRADNDVVRGPENI